MLPTPGFHHLHLNSMDPDAAIDFYTRRFASASRTTWGGAPALHSATNVLILFTKVDAPPKTAPQTAIWHFGWHVPDTQATKERFLAQRPDVTLLPLYTGDGDGSVWVSSDTWPGTGGLLGRTMEQIAEAKASGVEPTRTGGFGYIAGPDGAIIEYAGNQPVERFNHMHMWQEQPFCAQLWYQEHLNAPVQPGRGTEVTADTCVAERTPDLTFPSLTPEGMYRAPSSGVAFDDVAFLWYMRQGEEPLVSPRGYVWDHVALSVQDLDAWYAKLRGEGVRILEEIYPLGDTRAFMIEGPSLEAIELVEVRP